MSRKNTNNVKSKPIYEVTCGSITGSAFRRVTNSGFSYIDFTLTRSWTSQSTGKLQRSGTFFQEHEKDIVECCRQMANWIRAQNSAVVGEESETACDPADGVIRGANGGQRDDVQADV